MTLAARLAPHLPPRLLTTATDLLYPRFEPELRHLADFCPPGGTAVDVGGWYGPWTRRLAHRATRVVTVEPVPHLAQRLRDTTPANVEVLQAAATDRTGTATLWLPRDGRGDRGVSSLVRRREIHATPLDVPCLALDELALSDVTMLKIDVDGSELAVLQGAEQTIRRSRPALFIELELRIQPMTPVLDLLSTLDYGGWVRPAQQWLPLDRFDLAHHQKCTAHVAEHGLLRRSLAPHRRYVNSVLFLPRHRVPAEAGTRTHHGRHSPQAP
ncbi:FkbM family methyltransferase [Streptomyces sp. HNM0574]|uniref:FkbM family methyltransferase n=1 Tax=Streptomyces sp. HNM0574 TaxID=2714954 RepID=UPI00146F5A52|nr:FkbM family methyltransferase [Streptomyces sp. HNM0574]NLU69232.1 FkbM family methyltransferase [Streptomyces sp. HNM0574]